MAEPRTNSLLALPLNLTHSSVELLLPEVTKNNALMSKPFVFWGNHSLAVFGDKFRNQRNNVSPGFPHTSLLMMMMQLALPVGYSPLRLVLYYVAVSRWDVELLLTCPRSSRLVKSTSPTPLTRSRPDHTQVSRLHECGLPVGKRERARAQQEVARTNRSLV